jgi:hypothetical protein
VSVRSCRCRCAGVCALVQAPSAHCWRGGEQTLDRPMRCTRTPSVTPEPRPPQCTLKVAVHWRYLLRRLRYSAPHVPRAPSLGPRVVSARRAVQRTPGPQRPRAAHTLTSRNGPLSGSRPHTVAMRWVWWAVAGGLMLSSSLLYRLSPFQRAADTRGLRCVVPRLRLLPR